MWPLRNLFPLPDVQLTATNFKFFRFLFFFSTRYIFFSQYKCNDILRRIVKITIDWSLTFYVLFYRSLLSECRDRVSDWLSRKELFEFFTDPLDSNYRKMITSVQKIPIKCFSILISEVLLTALNSILSSSDE